MICNFCENEMGMGSECVGGIDPSAIPAKFADHVKCCHDCGVAPGSLHHPGCDTERCGCGRQAISCGCDDAFYEAHRAENRWSGVWPGVAECHELGFWCRNLRRDFTPYEEFPSHEDVINERVLWHVQCEPGAVGARPDLNRWAEHVARNSRKASNS
jgi:hypothetical protein